MINAMSLDLEFWNSSEFLKSYPLKDDDYVIESLEPLLRLFHEYDVKVTFFVLGSLAEKYPELVKSIHDQGHEIASHGYSHELMTSLTKDKVKEEIVKSSNLLKKITKEKPIGFRASHFSLTQKTSYILDILKDHGFEYSSNVFPIKVPINFLNKKLLYKFPNAPVEIYRPSKEDIMKHDPDGKIVEVPLAVYQIFGCNLPAAGGFYLRTSPAWLLKMEINSITKKRPAVLYIHPAESNPRIPKIESVSMFEKFVSYYGRKTVLPKLESIFKSFKFTTIRDLLETRGYL